MISITKLRNGLKPLTVSCSYFGLWLICEIHHWKNCKIELDLNIFLWKFRQWCGHIFSPAESNIGKCFFKKTEYDVSLKKWATPGLFIFISSSFNYIWQKVNKCTIKIRRLLDSNRRPLMSEATALITESQPLPKTEYVYRASLGHKIICLTWGGKGY